MSKTFEDQVGNCLEYCQYGSGEKFLFCFPGFGETFKSFENLAQNMGGHTVISINLYYVGKSERRALGVYLTHTEWQTTFSEFLQHLDVDRFSVLGFSLGGRFAISTFSHFHDRMDHLVLCASDGIIKRFSYQFSTFPIGPRQLFYFLMNHPKPFFILIDVLNKLGLVNPFTAKFTKTQLHDESKRLLVYDSWITFKHLRVAQRRLIELLNSSKCQSTIIFGEKDKIISPKGHKSFLNQLQNSKVLILPYGHNKLVDNVVGDIKETLHF